MASDIVVPDPPQVRVVGVLLEVTVGEFVAAQLAKGDRVRVEPRDGAPYEGVWEFSWFFDCVIGHVRERYDATITHDVFPTFGDRVIPLDRAVIRTLELTHGQ